MRVERGGKPCWPHCGATVIGSRHWSALAGGVDDACRSHPSGLDRCSELNLAHPAQHFEAHGLGLSDGADFAAPGWLRLNLPVPCRRWNRPLLRLNRQSCGCDCCQKWRNLQCFNSARTAAGFGCLAIWRNFQFTAARPNCITADSVTMASNGMSRRWLDAVHALKIETGCQSPVAAVTAWPASGQRIPTVTQPIAGRIKGVPPAAARPGGTRKSPSVGVGMS